MNAFFLLLALLGAQAQTTFTPKLASDGKASLEGFWNNAAGSAPWDIEPHPAAFQIPAGDGIIVDPADRKIPYKPAALAQRNDLRDHHIFDDPQGHCAPSGLPRQTYTPFGFQILQTKGAVVILYAVLGGVLALLFLQLSTRVESSPVRSDGARPRTIVDRGPKSGRLR